MTEPTNKLTFDPLLADLLEIPTEPKRPRGEHVLVIKPETQHIGAKLVCLALEAGAYMSVNCHYAVGHYREGEVGCGYVETWDELFLDALEEVPAELGPSPTWRLPVTVRFEGSGEDSEMWVQPLAAPDPETLVRDAKARVRATMEFRAGVAFGVPEDARDAYLDGIVRAALGVT